jgi:hypothetical protein
MGMVNSRGWVPVNSFCIVSCPVVIIFEIFGSWQACGDLSSLLFHSGLWCHFLFKFVESMINIQLEKTRPPRDGTPNQQAPIRKGGGPNRTAMNLSFVFTCVLSIQSSYTWFVISSQSSPANSISTKALPASSWRDLKHYSRVAVSSNVLSLQWVCWDNPDAKTKGTAALTLRESNAIRHLTTKHGIRMNGSFQSMMQNRNLEGKQWIMIQHDPTFIESLVVFVFASASWATKFLQTKDPRSLTTKQFSRREQFPSQPHSKSSPRSGPTKTIVEYGRIYFLQVIILSMQCWQNPAESMIKRATYACETRSLVPALAVLLASNLRS